VVGAFARTLAGLLRSGLFVALLLASRVLVPVLRLMATAGIVVFGFCALARRDEVTVMWAGAGLAGARRGDSRAGTVRCRGDFRGVSAEARLSRSPEGTRTRSLIRKD
jgi:hypothetical protein